MKYFVFRNATIERLFSNLECDFSGYADISTFDQADRYIWFYTQPYKADSNALANEIQSYVEMLQIIMQNIPQSKTMVAFTMANIFNISATSVNKVSRAIYDYNNNLYNLADNKYPNLKIVDFNCFLSNYPRNKWVDWKYYLISQMAINPRLAGDFEIWFAQEISKIELKRKKCLVLDLDNTLWGGILGEDGISGVKIGQGYPDEAYLMFQQYILELAKSGVILAVCSKNNLEDVRKMWAEHPSNLIKEENLAAYRINWNNKADNIREIAAELNIGTDSMVFIDDNPTERELVKGMLPDVEVPNFVDQPYQLPALISEITEKYFSVYSLTSEDLAKTEQYKANAEREKQRISFTDFSDYLCSLEIELSISSVNDLTIERAAQMTQKTNQFNLTTKRYTVSEIQQLLDLGAKAYTLSVKDKFGDNGITAFLIATIDGTTAKIDTLLMSCRVLGKHIEVEFVKFVINELFAQGIKTIEAQYIPTAKNGQTADFYDKLGAENLSNGNYRFQSDKFSYKQSNIYTITQ